MIEFTCIFSSEKTEHKDFYPIDEYCSIFSSRDLLCSEDKAVWLCFSGFISNAETLKRELIEKGHCFGTQNPEECIIHLYEEFQEHAAEHLCGSFVFVIYDQKERKVFVSRDRNGEKFVYYTANENSFICSTNIKNIISVLPEKPELNPQQIADAIGYSHPIGDGDTCFKNIFRLPFASNLKYSGGKKEIWSYWNRKSVNKFTGTREEAEKELLHNLKSSVVSAMGNNKTTAILLSGGIDSSVIASIARENFQEVHVFTAGYKGAFECDERFVAKRFAAEKDLIWHEVELSEDDYVNSFEEYSACFDEPVCDVAAFANWALFKEVKKQGFDTLLCGNGSDEMFFGYESENRLGELLSMPISGWFNIFIPQGRENFKLALKLLRWYKNPWIFFNAEKLANAIYTPHFVNALFRAKSRGFLPEKRSVPVLTTPDVIGVYDWLWDNWLTNNCNAIGCKFADALDIRLCSPFLDYRFCEFVFSLPMDYVYYPGDPKRLLKNAVNGMVPDYILNPEKKGFTPPKEYIDKIMDKYGKSSFNFLLTSEVCRNLTGEDL